MARSFIDKDRSDAPKHRHQGDQPPREAHHADLQAVSIPAAGEDGPDCSEGGGDRLADSVHRAEHRRVRGAVVEEDNGCGEGERTRRHLEEEDDDDREPYPGPVGLVRRRGGGRRERDVRRKGVRQREKREKVLVALGGAETAVDRWVDGELEEHADHAENGRCEAHALREHAQTAGEDERESLSGTGRVVGVITGSREEEKPEVVEGAASSV